jgi:hypothetical protein
MMTSKFEYTFVNWMSIGTIAIMNENGSCSNELKVKRNRLTFLVFEFDLN